MLQLYIKLVKTGRRSIDKIPEEYREAVSQAIADEQ